MDFVNNLTSVWDFFKNTEKPIILYGMGDGADKVLKVFDKLNIKPYGVMASDDFVRGQKFHGFTVKKLSQFENELSDFVIALCFAKLCNDTPFVNKLFQGPQCVCRACRRQAHGFNINIGFDIFNIEPVGCFAVYKNIFYFRLLKYLPYVIRNNVCDTAVG